MGDFGSELPTEATISSRSLPDTSTTAEDINVLVTGFGPFKTNPLNPSFLIASSLPSVIKLPSSKPSTTRHVRIHTHPSPVRVSYSAVQDAIPAILESFKRSHNGKCPDLIIHIGMASVRHYYAVETNAHRDEYKVTDVDGEEGYSYGEAIWKQHGLPSVLKPGRQSKDNNDNKDEPTSDLSSPEMELTSKLSNTSISPSTCPLDATFLKTWKSHLPEDTDVRLSEDAGRYLCEFIYYTSLALALREQRQRSVVFLHVPGWTDPSSIQNGREITIALVKSLVKCWIDGDTD